MTSDAPTPTPTGIAGLLMSVATRLDGAESPPAFQRIQTFLLLSLAVDAVWPHLPM
tara:strand:+ start:1085 stop:1252 length:168 start_codon:yes stop_codon:yes gene_type:complete